MASLSRRGVIGLSALIFFGGGAALAATSSDDGAPLPGDELALFFDEETETSASETTPTPDREPTTTSTTSTRDAASDDTPLDTPSSGNTGDATTTTTNAGPSGTAGPAPSTTLGVSPTSTARAATTAPTTAPKAGPTAAPTTAPTAAPTTAPTAAPSTTSQPSTTPPSTAARPAGVGFAGVSVGDHTNGNVNISQAGQDGSFRTVCTVSHFNFDDAIVFPGQQAATHLHMYFGNVLANFASTGESLASSGNATCQGGPLNRSAYWVPAVLDQNGDVRPAQYMLAYYKRAGDEDVVPYPNGLRMVVGNAMAMSPQPGREQPVDAGIDYKWSCGSPITGGSTNVGRLIPDCAAGDFLTLSVIFPRCSDGRLDSPDHKSHMAYPSAYGRSCPSSHPIRHPQLTYNIHWNNNDVNTGGWYLSSDIHGGMTMPGGTTTHADWIGAWHPEVLDIMTTGCFNADHDCKGGTISSTLRLDPPNVQGFSPPSIYDSNVAPTAIPFSTFGSGSTYAN